MALDPCHAFRAVGGHTSAAAKLHDILDIADLLGYVGTQRKFLCLADGSGGFAAYLLKCAPSSHAHMITKSELISNLDEEEQIATEALIW